ncbi:DinB family protein [Flagellimonas allohymeniacidonis]|uniref:DinB family protein n=1 Tax=Flagellimonas allohymeniacidonis TaxID=2517819 RepID=A0A4V6MMA1_9FLAO|nr:DinB family protein [Allomuricauda hymeniacidonis]TAI47800.1 DinB family protein [Allomuricauda hymeniacidonis]
MKKLVLPIIALFFFSFSADTNKLTDDERATLIKYLEETRDHMKSVLDGLSEEQLNYKPTEESWSIAECAEHLAISENAFSGLIQKAVAAGPNPTLKDSVKLKDDQLFGIITDRSNKVKTAEPFEPSGKFGSHEDTVKAFMEKRGEHIEYVKTTEDDLRNRFSNDLPFGTVDGFQIVMFAAGHTERHVLQMEEVMKDREFPEYSQE